MIDFKRFFILCAIVIIFAGTCQAEEAITETTKETAAVEPAQEKPHSLKGIEFLTGFGVARIREKGSYHVTPFLIDLDFDLKPLTKKIGINPSIMIQGIIEPFASYVSEPDNNAEIGNNFLIKIGFLPESSKVQPYFKGGVGVVYITQHTREQGTQFNFNEYAGIGMHYFFKKNIALTAEFRWRHLSNAGIDSPNSGINTNYGICGISYLF
ncbi:MAG: acyloxyacyl hydrolase [Candidatus Omnitrophica bacterium]|nr:acyloxyacyl hydrolase [Candidatus Omnitrophota bacterium]MDD5652860.1 acyloxyacyl hydrolase [Candidatus Omnitrophota bacterium]